MSLAARPHPTGHPQAVALAVLVTVLWSSSWVLITLGLERMPPITFAGLRYALGALILVGAALCHGRTRRQLTALTLRGWGELVALGVVLYAVTQGAQFVSLSLLPAATASLVLSFTPVVVALAAGAALQERLSRRALLGIVLGGGGAVTYFLAGGGLTATAAGPVAAVTGLLANAGAALLGRAVNRCEQLTPLAVTAPSMGVGAALLLLVGVPLQGLPVLTAADWLIVLVLAVVNTAVAFTLWNHALRCLTATESSTVNNTMLVQVAALGWLFLDQPLAPWQVAGVLAVTVGTTLVQLRRAPRPARPGGPARARGQAGALSDGGSRPPRAGPQGA